MRLAFVGKGGAGKSTIVGTFARLLARTGTEVVAVDSDPMPGLSYALGLPVVERPIPDDAVVEKADDDVGPRYRLRPGLDATTAIEAYAAIGADGVRFLSYGKTQGNWGDIARGQHAWSQILDELPRGRFDLIGDLPGGTRQPLLGWGKFADVIVIVVDPTPRSYATARRLATLRDSRWSYRDVVAVANRVVDAGDMAAVGYATGLEVIGALPLDASVAAADRLGFAPLDGASGGPFVTAVAALVECCVQRFVETATELKPRPQNPPKEAVA